MNSLYQYCPEGMKNIRYHYNIFLTYVIFTGVPSRFTYVNLPPVSPLTLCMCVYRIVSLFIFLSQDKMQITTGYVEVQLYLQQVTCLCQLTLMKLRQTNDRKEVEKIINFSIDSCGHFKVHSTT
jgi:hypothetical protein